MLNLIHWIINYRHEAGYRIDRPMGNNMYTVMLFRGPLRIYADGRMLEAPQNSCIVYEPFAPQLYYNDAHSYDHDGVFFDSHTPVTAFQELGIPLNRPFSVSAPSAIALGIQNVVEAATHKSPHSLQIIDLRLRDLIYTLADNILAEGKTGSYYYPLSQLRHRILSKPSYPWNIPEEAAALHISISYLQHLYRSYFGISPRQEIIHGRLAQAEYLLRLNEQSISSISEFCGYANEEHFIRQFKKYRGSTPSAYRNTYSRRQPSGEPEH